MLAPTFYWPLVESCLGIVAACLPTLRPLFQGMSPESVIRSIRSALSLQSFSGNRLGHRLENESKEYDATSNSSAARMNDGAVYSGSMAEE